jgi:NitT/TauT family transport system permease protein
MKTLEVVVPPTVLILGVLIIWQVLVSIFHIPAWQMPGPLLILRSMKAELRVIGPQLFITYRNIIIGFLIAVVLGLSLAITINFYHSIGIALTPFINLLCIMPLITVVPLLMLWVGFGNEAKLIAIVLQSSPIINLNTSASFANVGVLRLELMESMRAGRFQTLKYCLIPAAIPGIFTGIKLAAVFSMMAEITSEIAGGDQGLGAQIIKYASYMKMPEAFACIFFVALFGVLFYQVISMVEQKLVKS